MHAPGTHFVSIGALAALIAAAVPMIAAAQQQPTAVERDCIDHRRIDSTKVLDDRNVLFFMHGHQAYRNTLLDECPALRTEDRFSYRTTDSLQHLCKSTLITVLSRAGGYAVASCRLGAFLPLSEDEADKLVASAATPSRRNKKGDAQGVNAQPVVPAPGAQPRSDSAVPTTTPSTPDH